MSLQDQLDQAHERIAQLEEMLGLDTEFPLSLALTPTEAQLLGLLLRRPTVNVWSRGHRLTDDGRRKLKEIIEDAE